MLGGWSDARAAMRAIQPYESLGEYAVERRDETVRVYTHMRETAQHVEYVVGVHSGEHQMSGQRRLHGNLRSFGVADFADHDFVRIVAQYRAQPARKREPLFFVDRNLQHSRQLILDGVFDGDYFVAAMINFGECRIERGRFAAAGRTGDEEHAIGLGT